MNYYIYILASRIEGALYTGVTNNLIRRLSEHREKKIDGHTKKYNESMLVYYEMTSDIKSAIQREKQLKRWKRSWKIRLIEENNPKWRDLYQDIIEQ